MNAHSFVFMGGETSCCPCHSAAHCWHMKRQPSLCHCCHHRGRYHCNCRCRHSCHRRLCCPCHRRCPLPLPLPSAVAVAVAIAHRHWCLNRIAVSHRRCPHPPHWPLPSPLLSAIAVAISIGHQLPRHGKNCIQTVLANNAYSHWRFLEAEFLLDARVTLSRKTIGRTYHNFTIPVWSPGSLPT